MTKRGPRWWVIREEVLHAALVRAQNGDDAGIVLLELTANADVETVEPDCE